jgi:hypothetical protein
VKPAVSAIVKKIKTTEFPIFLFLHLGGKSNNKETWGKIPPTRIIIGLSIHTKVIPPFTAVYKPSGKIRIRIKMSYGRNLQLFIIS